MMACEGSTSAWEEKFGEFIYQFKPEMRTLVKKLERILIKLYRQHVSISFNQTCLNEGMQPNYTQIYIYIYIYMEANYGKKSDSMEKIEKQSNPEVVNLFQRKVDVKIFQF